MPRAIPDTLNEPPMKKAGTVPPIRENVGLAAYTTLGVGGNARFLACIQYDTQIPEALEFARVRACPVCIIGGGSNLLVSDAGFPGLILRMEMRGILNFDGEDSGFISAAAGEDWDGFVQRCIEQNLAGIECLSGIPGTVGAAPVQNIGAYGEEIGNVILSIRVMDLKTADVEELSARDCLFDYRSSIFNTTHKDRYIILKVVFALRPYGKPRIQYRDLADHFAGRMKSPGLWEVRRTVIAIRSAKGMVLDATDADSKSAGSFFKNPVLDTGRIQEVENLARDKGLLAPSGTLPRFSAPKGGEKLPAAWLIEQAGFKKGYTCGNVGISRKHALAFVNHGGGRAREFIDLMQRVQDKVFEEFGIVLEPEPTLVGFDL